MCQLTLHTDGGSRTVSFQPGASLGALLREQAPWFAQPCGGNHTCGKCRVRVTGGVSQPQPAELALLGDGAEQDLRLACFCTLTGDAQVHLQPEASSRILSWHTLPPVTCTGEGYGLAVDIGTTTVVAQLYHRPTGQVLAQRMEENIQRGYGADVISRIEACQREGVSVLSDAIAGQLESMAAGCMADAGVSGLSESVVTGNTTMLHLYEGLDPASLAVVPFTVPSRFGCPSRRTLAGAPVYLPRCIGAYVGADIVCAILASQLTQPGTRLLADIGTNGEMVLSHDGALLCCSTAAGPAFEGAGLSCGMPAKAGAICKVSRTGTALSWQTVQDQPPAGICGSGVLDALALALEDENLDESGFLEEEIQLGPVSVTQKDVRQIQLAKSAVCAGLLTLLEEAGTPSARVDVLSIAGGFGSSLDLDSAAAVGLFPADLRDKTCFIGNGALGGAAMLLLQPQLRARAEAMADGAREISLSASQSFMDRYIDCMNFARF